MRKSQCVHAISGRAFSLSCVFEGDYATPWFITLPVVAVAAQPVLNLIAGMKQRMSEEKEKMREEKKRDHFQMSRRKN